MHSSFHFPGVHRIVIPNQMKVFRKHHNHWIIIHCILTVSVVTMQCCVSALQKYFIVMQSVFYPDERINIRYIICFPHVLLCGFWIYILLVYKVMFLLHRYDIKGCEVGRWTNPDMGGKQIIKVLKDRNLSGQFISLGKCPHPYTNLLCLFPQSYD